MRPRSVRLWSCGSMTALWLSMPDHPTPSTPHLLQRVTFPIRHMGHLAHTTPNHTITARPRSTCHARTMGLEDTTRMQRMCCEVRKTLLHRPLPTQSNGPIPPGRRSRRTTTTVKLRDKESHQADGDNVTASYTRLRISFLLSLSV